MTVEPITVWAAFGSFVLGVLVGALVVLDELKRARRRWREATRTWHEIEAVAVELRDEFKELPRRNAPDLVAAIRDGVREQLKRKRSGRPDLFMQGWAAADLGDGEAYEPETCTACGRVHLVNPKSGEVLESAKK